jgi:hypothetical protein
VAGALGRARLYNDVGVAHLAANDRKGARVWFESAAAQAKIAGHEVELVDISESLALVAERPEERDRLFAQEVSEYTQALGADHALTLRARLDAATFITDPTAAAAALRPACRTLQQLHPHLQDMLDTCWYELGWLAEERGDLTEARAAFAAVRSSDDDGLVARGYLQLLDGNPLSAATAMMELGSQLENAPESWLHVSAADAFFVASMSWQRVGRERDAERMLSSGVRLLETIDDTPSYARRLARYRSALARLVAKTDPQRARGLAELAGRWYQAAGGYDAVAAQMKAITDSH